MFAQHVPLRNERKWGIKKNYMQRGRRKLKMPGDTRERERERERVCVCMREIEWIGGE